MTDELVPIDDEAEEDVRNDPVPTHPDDPPQVDSPDEDDPAVDHEPTEEPS